MAFSTNIVSVGLMAAGTMAVNMEGPTARTRSLDGIRTPKTSQARSLLLDDDRQFDNIQEELAVKYADMSPNVYFKESDTTMSFFQNLARADPGEVAFDQTQVVNFETKQEAKEKFVIWTATLTIDGILDAVRLTGGKPENVTFGSMPYNWKTLFPSADQHKSSFKDIKDHAEAYYLGAKLVAANVQLAKKLCNHDDPRKDNDFFDEFMPAVYDLMLGIQPSKGKYVDQAKDFVGQANKVMLEQKESVAMEYLKKMRFSGSPNIAGADGNGPKNIAYDIQKKMMPENIAFVTETSADAGEVSFRFDAITRKIVNKFDPKSKTHDENFLTQLLKNAKNLNDEDAPWAHWPKDVLAALPEDELSHWWPSYQSLQDEQELKKFFTLFIGTGKLEEGKDPTKFGAYKADDLDEDGTVQGTLHQMVMKSLHKSSKQMTYEQQLKFAEDCHLKLFFRIIRLMMAQGDNRQIPEVDSLILPDSSAFIEGADHRALQFGAKAVPLFFGKNLDDMMHVANWFARLGEQNFAHSVSGQDFHTPEDMEAMTTNLKTFLKDMDSFILPKGIELNFVHDGEHGDILAVMLFKYLQNLNPNNQNMGITMQVSKDNYDKVANDDMFLPGSIYDLYSQGRRLVMDDYAATRVHSYPPPGNFGNFSKKDSLGFVHSKDGLKYRENDEWKETVKKALDHWHAKGIGKHSHEINWQYVVNTSATKNSGKDQKIAELEQQIAELEQQLQQPVPDHQANDGQAALGQQNAELRQPPAPRRRTWGEFFWSGFGLRGQQ